MQSTADDWNLPCRVRREAAAAGDVRHEREGPPLASRWRRAGTVRLNDDRCESAQHKLTTTTTRTFSSQILAARCSHHPPEGDIERGGEGWPCSL